MEIVVRATIIFFFLWFVTRAMGKRELAGMSAFELVLLVIFGDLVQQGVTQNDMSVTGAILAVGTIAFLTMTFSAISYRWKGAANVIQGRPVIVVRDGIVLEDALRYERLSIDDMKDAAREQGIGSVDDVVVGILESSGKFSFITHAALAHQQQPAPESRSS
jgi:uncharacterized membrane protein YcaP (DUF421 family)